MYTMYRSRLYTRWRYHSKPRHLAVISVNTRRTVVCFSLKFVDLTKTVRMLNENVNIYIIEKKKTVSLTIYVLKNSALRKINNSDV